MKNFIKERINSLDLKSSEDKIIESFENYLRTKFLDLKNDKIEKNLKSYKKDLNEKFKDKINQLNNLLTIKKNLILLISDLISNMNLDENLDEEEEKRNEEKITMKNKTNQKIKISKKAKEDQARRNVHRLRYARS